MNNIVFEGYKCFGKRVEMRIINLVKITNQNYQEMKKITKNTYEKYIKIATHYVTDWIAQCVLFITIIIRKEQNI